MTQEEFLKHLQEQKEILVNEVALHFANRQTDKGDLAFRRWKERFVKFLRDYVPSEADRFVTEHSRVSFTAALAGGSHRESILERFHRTNGSICLAFIDNLKDEISKGYIKIPETISSENHLKPSPAPTVVLQDIEKLDENLQKEPLGAKLWRFSESNLFWGGGVAVVLAGYAFLLTGALKFSVALILIGWIVITISVIGHKFFENRSHLYRIIFITLISFLILGLFAALFWGLIPDNQISSNSNTEAKFTPKPSQPVNNDPKPPVTNISPTTTPNSLDSNVVDNNLSKTLKQERVTVRRGESGEIFKGKIVVSVIGISYEKNASGDFVNIVTGEVGSVGNTSYKFTRKIVGYADKFSIGKDNYEIRITKTNSLEASFLITNVNFEVD